MRDTDTTVVFIVVFYAESWMNIDMISIQDLLDEEAKLSNAGKKDSVERKEILALIRLKRDESYRPVCFGHDDCSTDMLSRCAWRNECG